MGCLQLNLETWRSKPTSYILGQVHTLDSPTNGSDTAKFLEAACYALMKRDDPHLLSEVEQQIEWICTSQWDDGYINSYYTLVEPQNRFTNLRYGFALATDE